MIKAREQMPLRHERLTFPTSDTGWDAARALLLLDELGMLETTSLGTATARQQRAAAAAESIAIILRRHREMWLP